MALSFFLRLMLGHMIGDFFLQPYWLVLAKRKGWMGLFIHVGVVTFITALFLWSSIPNWWVWVIVLYIGHLFIDQFRTFIFTDNSKGKGLLLLLLDQLAHVLLIALIAWLATGWTISDLAPLITNGANQGRLMVYLICLAIAISVAPVLEAETTVAVLAMLGTEITHTVKIEFSDRLLGAIERILAIAILLLGYGLLIPLLFIPRLTYMIREGQLKTDKVGVITKVATSLVITVLVGLLLLNIPLIPIFA
jgi:hypothetical protein